MHRVGEPFNQHATGVDDLCIRFAHYAQFEFGFAHHDTRSMVGETPFPSTKGSIGRFPIRRRGGDFFIYGPEFVHRAA